MRNEKRGEKKLSAVRATHSWINIFVGYGTTFLSTYQISGLGLGFILHFPLKLDVLNECIICLTGPIILIKKRSSATFLFQHHGQLISTTALQNNS